MSNSNSSRRFSFTTVINQGFLRVFKTVKRFPLTVFLLFCLTVVLIDLYEINYFPTDERTAATLAFGVALSLFFCSIKERYGENYTILTNSILLALQLVLIFLFGKFIMNNTNMPAVVTFWFTTFSLLIGFVLIPYLSKEQGLEIYITKLITRAGISVFFTFCLVIGTIAVLASIKALLISSLNTNLYFYTFIIGAVFFAPINFLSALPQKAIKYKLKDYGWVLRVAFTYIALPLLTIYTVILYLYFGKVIITGTWPSGIVSYLVVSYSAVGIASIFMLQPYKNKNRWVGMFSVIYTKAIFPLLAMMFYAIILRINQYGFTENRYFVLVIGLWATFIMVFANFNKGKRNIVYLISLALTLLICVYGPLNAFNISINSQNSRFNSILTKNNMLKDNVIIQNDSISEVDKREITNIINYFSYNHSLNQLKVLPAGFKIKNMQSIFGFKPLYRIPDTNAKYLFYIRKEEVLDIAGYDYHLKYFDRSEKDITLKDSVYTLSVNDDIFKITSNNNVLITVDLNEYVKSLYNKYKVINRNYFTAEELSLVISNEEIEVKIYFRQINCEIDIEKNEVIYDNATGDILIKLKN